MRIVSTLLRMKLMLKMKMDIDDIGEEKTFYRRRIAGLAMNEIAATLKDSKRPSRTLRDPWETGSCCCSLLN